MCLSSVYVDVLPSFLNIWTSVSIMTLSIKLMLKTLLLGVVLTSRRTIHHHDGHHIVWWWILATMYVYIQSFPYYAVRTLGKCHLPEKIKIYWTDNGKKC